MVVEPVAGGEYFTIRTQSTVGGPSGLSIVSLDRQEWRFKSRFFDPSGYVSDVSAGTFDAATNVLTMSNFTKNDLILTRRQTFLDADTMRIHMTAQDKQGESPFRLEGDDSPAAETAHHR